MDHNRVIRVKEDLKTALKVELATIPLYLYAMHSIRIDDTEQGKKGAAARAKIGVVVRQEMLHLALAGNIFTALDSGRHLGPKLYSEEYLVKYGQDELLSFKVPLKLGPCNKESLERFMLLESPYIEPLDDGEPAPPMPKMTILDDSKSIGEFYAKLKKDIARITHWGNKDYQFSSAEFFGSNMVQVSDKESALKALDIIVEQGEGGSAVDVAHYLMFLGLWERVDWKCWPVPSSPTVTMYQNSPFVYQLALAYNAAYCYLLITIQKTWEVSVQSTRLALNRNIHAIMLSVLGPLGYFIAKQPFNGGTAGPTFEFYSVPEGENLDRVDDTAKALHKAIGDHIDNAPDSSQNPQLQSIRLSINQIGWPIN